MKFGIWNLEFFAPEPIHKLVPSNARGIPAGDACGSKIDPAWSLFKMRKQFFAIAVCLIATAAFASDLYTLTGENTKIEFVGKKSDGKHAGGFKKVDGAIEITDGKITTMLLALAIDMDSIYTDDEKLTAHLKSPDFFDVKKNARSAFSATKATKVKDGFEIVGNMLINDKKKAMTIPATIEINKGVLTITGETKINRSDFGITYGKGKIDEEVEIKFSISAKKDSAKKD